MATPVHDSQYPTPWRISGSLGVIRAPNGGHRVADHNRRRTGDHTAATVFWAAFYEAWLLARAARNRLDALGRATAVAALAAAVDHTITRRFTPGWELVLTKRSMALVYAAIATGLIVVRA